MSEQGIVKWYSLAKGYGFIRRQQAGEEDEDVLMHHSEVPDDNLTEGERVHFEVVESPKGLRARKVRRVAPDAGPGARPE